MNIAILSGKGGTGKTTVSTNLAIALKSNYVDCDVEEPNGFLFLNPKIQYSKTVNTEYPEIDKYKCINCGKCSSICQFNALIKIKKDIVLFNKLCHSCGACEIVCESNAITYKNREIGKIEVGFKDDIKCYRGILNVGEVIAVPVIKETLKIIGNEINLIDCPPGTSCNVVNVLKSTDIAILITEPSEFGLHDLKIAIKLVKMYNIPFAVIINKDDNKENIIKKYCNENNTEIIGTIPYNKDTAKIYSRGEIMYRDFKHKLLFDKIANKVKEMIRWS